MIVIEENVVQQEHQKEKEYIFHVEQENLNVDQLLQEDVHGKNMMVVKEDIVVEKHQEMEKLFTKHVEIQLEEFVQQLQEKDVNGINYQIVVKEEDVAQVNGMDLNVFQILALIIKQNVQELKKQIAQKKFLEI